MSYNSFLKLEQLSNFTVYKSSAGSGKTFTLVKSYLRIALADETVPPVKYKSILAITFTNKAAGEMKDRIVSTLRSISGQGIEDPMGEVLCKELKLSSEKIKMRAGNLLSEILHNYGEFSVSTIDRFVHRVIRTFALDLRLPLNFSIETNTELILSRCVDDLMRKVGEDKMLTDILFQFSRSRAEEDKSWRVEHELLKFAKQLIKDDTADILSGLKQNDAKVLIRVKDDLWKSTITFENKLKQFGISTMEWIHSNGLSIDDFFQKGKGIYNYFNRIGKGECAGDLCNSYVKATIEQGKWKSSKSNLREDQSTYLKERFHEIEKYRKDGLEHYQVSKAILGNIYSLMVIHELQSLLNKLKQDESFVFISEFNALISEIIKTEPVPFIYERIGDKYSHYLLDEFQDTSVLQWNNLLPLVDNSLASKNYNLVVGDGKQSIYRWRGGDVNQFADLPLVQGVKNRIMQEREDSLIRNYHEEVLKVNYRSREEIIHFNNALFEWLRDTKLSPNYKKVYKDCLQQTQKDKTGGFISFDIIHDPEHKDLYEQKVCEKTEEYIRLNREQLGFQFSDITILVRTKYSGKIIADFLLSRNIPIVSSETLLLGSNQSVSFVVALLDLLQVERNQVEEAKVLHYISDHLLKDGTTYDLLWSEFSVFNGSLWEFLNQKKVLSNTREYYASLPLFELCCTLIRHLNPLKSDDLFLQFFLDEVLKYSTNNTDNLNSFLYWWKEQGVAVSAILPFGSDAVNIMTFHASKGLQFPVVIVPFADWEICKTEALWVEIEEPQIPEIKLALVNSPSQLKETKYEQISGEEKEKQILDNVNLMYVAFTRPEDHLHLISRNRNNGNYADAWLREFFTTNGQWLEKELCYKIGKLGKKSRAGKQMHELMSYQLNITDRLDRLQLKTSSDFKPEEGEVAAKTTYGILFHKAMSQIFQKEDALKVSSGLVSQGLCSVELAEEIQQKVLKLMSNPLVSSFFPECTKSMNEPELITNEGNYRPDRLVFLQNEVYVVEYKTGDKKNQHLDQLLNYSRQISQLFSLKVRNFIVYTADETVEEIESVQLSA